MSGKYRSPVCRAAGLRQGQQITIKHTPTGLSVSGVGPRGLAQVKHDIIFDAKGRARPKRGSILQKSGAQIKQKR